MTRRDMQIFFERTIQLIDPTLVAENKITSDAIFQFIYASFIRYIKQNLGITDQVESNTQVQKIHSDIYKRLLTKDTIVPDSTEENIDSFSLPEDYLLYVRSDSSLTKQYINQENEVYITPNITLKENDIQKVIPSFYNSPIIPNPFVVLRNDKIELITDNHTSVKDINLYYIRKPESLKLTEDNATVEYKDMPESICTEVIEQAVNMFITEAKYRLSVKPSNNQQ